MIATNEDSTFDPLLGPVHISLRLLGNVALHKIFVALSEHEKRLSAVQKEDSCSFPDKGEGYLRTRVCTFYQATTERPALYINTDPHPRVTWVSLL
jgi:hypothetical protein